MRHTDNCLNAEIAAVIQKRKIDNAVDALAELCEQLEFAKELKQAAKEFLRDDNGKIELMPRTHEIDVLIEEFRGNRAVRSTVTLRDLIDRVDGKGFDVISAASPYIDIRKFALEAIRTTDPIIDKFLKIEGLYTKDRDNPDELRNTIEAIKFFLDKHPEADREEVIEAYAIPKGFSKDQIIQNLEGVQ